MSSITTPAEAARSELAGFEGRLIGPDESDYEEARAVYNAMIDKRPAVIARCASLGDVSRAIAFARDHDLLLAIRGGGHNGAGLGTCDDGVVIDLSLLKEIQVDPMARTVRVGGGCTWGEVDQATGQHGLATPSGIISTTGVGGLTLGGGIGHLTRKCGLTVDNLLEAELVLASGERVRVNGEEHPDLYWAIRGGGGNFGVVTSFLFRLHEVGTVIAGPTFWPVELGADVLSVYREFLPSAPRELNGFFAFHTVPPAPPFPEEIHLRKVCGVVWCYVGSEEDAARAMAPLLDALPEPLMHGVGQQPFGDRRGPHDFRLNGGFDAFVSALNGWKPQLLIHGHMHHYDGAQKPYRSGATTILNAYPYKLLQIPMRPQEVAETKTASAHLSIKRLLPIDMQTEWSV